jgi:hypothetical protein
MFCPTCGNRLPSDAGFCPSCGTARPALADDTDQAPAPSPGTEPASPPPAPQAPPVSAGPAAPSVGSTARTATAGFLTRLRIDKPLAVTAAKQAAVVLGAAVVTLTLIELIIVLVTDVHLGLTEVLRSAVFVVGAAFGGALHLSGEANFFGSAAGEVKVWVVPTFVTVLLGGTIAVLGARHERTRKSENAEELVGGALMTGAAITIGLLILSVLSRGSFSAGGGDSDISASANIGLSFWSLLFGGLVVATASSLIGRVLASSSTSYIRGARARISGRVPTATGDLQTPVLFVATLAVICVVAGGVEYLVSDGPAKGLLLVLPFLPTVALAMGALGMGATGVATATGSGNALDIFDMSQSQHSSAGMFGADSHVSYWLLALPVAAAIVAGVASGARSPVTRDKLTSVWKSGAATALLFLVLGLLLRVTGSGKATGGYGDVSVGGSAHMSVHMGLVSLVLLAFAWGCLARAAGIWLTVPLARRLPRTVEFAGRKAARLAGEQRLAPAWSAELASLTRQLGKQPRRTAEDANYDNAYLPSGLTAKKHTGKILGGVCVGAVVLGGAWLVLDKVVAPRLWGPQTQVSAYFAKLQNGDAAGALAMQDGRPPHGPLLTNAALRKQMSQSPIGHVRILHTETGDGWATVKLRYQTDGTTRTGSVDLVSDTKHKHFLVWPTWKLASATSQLQLKYGGALASARVDGVEVGAGTLDVFPGTHAVTGKADPLFDAQQRTRTIGFPGRSSSVRVRTSLSGAGESAVENAALAAISACADQGLISPKDCTGWPDVWAMDAKNVEWTLPSQPSVQVSTEGDGTIAVEVTGTAHVDYREPYIGAESEDDDLDMYGTVDTSYGKPTVSWEDQYSDW